MIKGLLIASGGHVAGVVIVRAGPALAGPLWMEISCR